MFFFIKDHILILGNKMTMNVFGEMKRRWHLEFKTTGETVQFYHDAYCNFAVNNLGLESIS